MQIFYSSSFSTCFYVDSSQPEPNKKTIILILTPLFSLIFLPFDNLFLSFLVNLSNFFFLYFFSFIASILVWTFFLLKSYTLTVLLFSFYFPFCRFAFLNSPFISFFLPFALSFPWFLPYSFIFLSFCLSFLVNLSCFIFLTFPLTYITLSI